MIIYDTSHHVYTVTMETQMDANFCELEDKTALMMLSDATTL